MFQRLTSLFFGEVEEVYKECSGPKPCISEADEDDWLLVSLPGSYSHSRGRGLSCPFPCPRGSTPLSPGCQSDCSSGFERCCMDESWFVTPPPCFTAEGSTPEASPMEDLLIEHPSMSVYVSTGNQSVAEETGSLVLQETSQRVDPAVSAGRALSSRPPRGSASQAAALAKVAQVSRVQRAKARSERRQLGRHRLQRQNRLRDLPRHSGPARGGFLHQPCQRRFNY
uniref:Tumor protein p53 inducible nuclear protein 2 n=1 Tax=Lepisosteus oculatus TaxID=7918 RepID=W5MAB6_LEPOC